MDDPHEVTIEVTIWDQLIALERVVQALSKALDLTDRSEDFYFELQKDVACLIFLREELKIEVDAQGEDGLAN